MADNLNNSSTTADNTNASVDPRAEVVVVEIPSQDLKPSITEDEETLIAKMYNLVGERWSLIAGRIPGRTAEEIKKYWNSICSSTDQ